MIVVHASTRQLALLWILRAHDRQQGVSVPELERAWRKQGLRFGDLRQTVRELGDRHALVLRGEPPVKRIVMTPKGHKELGAFDAGLLRFMIDWFTLTRIKRRRRVATRLDSKQQRRRSDR